MADQIRSADLMVKNILSDPAKIQAVKDNPTAALEDYAQIATSQLHLTDPSSGVNNILWLIIVSAFAIIMLGSAFMLAWTMIMPKAGGSVYITASETVVMIFTTAVAFLAGLLSPSPVKKS